MQSLSTLARRFWYVLLAFFILAIVFSIREAYTQDEHGDPYIFWAAGLKFMADTPLYEPIPGAQEYIYPPVAAWLFQLLAIFPFPVATGLFTFFNFAAWLGLIGLTYLLLVHFSPNRFTRTALLIAVIATIRYYWHNIIWVNVNEGVALLSVGGLYSYVRGRENLGLLLLTLAMWVKVMPILLVVVLLIRRPVSTLWKVGGYSLLFALLVFLQRGVAQGIQDYLDYWYVVFRPFLLEGRVYTDWIAFGISATLSKLLTAHPDINGIRYHIAEWQLALVNKISLIVRLALVGITYYFAWKTRRQAALPVLLLTYLTILLVAGVSWEGHHVTLLPVVAGLYQYLTELSLFRLRKVMTVVSIAVGLMTSDLLGGRLSDYVQGFSLITYLVLFLFGVAAVVNARLIQARNHVNR